jgi:RNA polymerase sigma-70 factor (ECF subfamily)
MEYALLSDELLTKLLHAGDADAFKEIYNRYWKKLYHTALAKTHTQQIAEELVQTIFMAVWEKRATAPIEQLESYLMRAMKYKIINYIQSVLVKEKYLKVINEDIIKEENDSEALALLHELNLAIHTAIEKLPAKTKAIFKLSREENHTIQEIAQLMNLSEKAVEYHITQSLKLMRLHLKDFMVLETFFVLHQLL